MDDNLNKIIFDKQYYLDNVICKILDYYCTSVYHSHSNQARSIPQAKTAVR